ncbi:MAG TPA: hypothetical protein VNZ86_07150 [Bacteroidia bacterium]|nr:hypothetical protein [Bacteroidia bacterium]
MKGQSQVTSPGYYRDEYRITLMQPGLEYIRHYTPRLGIGISSGWVPIAGSKSYSVLQGQYQVLPHANYFFGSGVNVIFTGRYTAGRSTWFMGTGYRFFNAPSSWYTVNVINDLQTTELLVSEQNNSLLLFLGYEKANSNVHAYSIAYHIRMGASLGNFVVKYMDEQYTYRGPGIPTTYDPSIPVPPYSKSEKIEMFYVNLSVSIGKRVHLMPAN